jgi:thioredoxin reductase
MVDIIVIGGGPAGLTAAVYARRAGKSVLVLEKDALGGQITWSPKVENYPAVPAVSGMDLGNRMAEQAMDMGADCVLVNTAIAVAGDPVKMADAFRQAVIAGRQAYEAGLGAIADSAEASSPLTAFLNV